MLGLLLAGCATAPPGTYFPILSDPDTQKVSHALYRAARAAGDDPDRYSFALVRSAEAQAYSDTDATFYVTDGLAHLPAPVVEAVLAHEVAHEILGHAGKRRALSLSMRAGFTVLGILFPGVGLADLVINPLVVRAFARDQEKQADVRGVKILRVMGYEAPRRALASALETVEAINRDTEPAGGIWSTYPPTAERLAALEPLEPATAVVAEAHLWGVD
ncbi:MAG: M48 family metalloprotease [Candidatus Methylomirabilia bacterium]